MASSFFVPLSQKKAEATAKKPPPKPLDQTHPIQTSVSGDISSKNDTQPELAVIHSQPCPPLNVGGDDIEDMKRRMDASVRIVNDDVIDDEIDVVESPAESCASEEYDVNDMATNQIKSRGKWFNQKDAPVVVYIRSVTESISQANHKGHSAIISRLKTKGPMIRPPDPSNALRSVLKTGDISDLNPHPFYYPDIYTVARVHPDRDLYVWS